MTQPIEPAFPVEPEEPEPAPVEPDPDPKPDKPHKHEIVKDEVSDDDPDCYAKREYQEYLQLARDHLKGAEDFEPGTGGRATEVAAAQAYISFATELRLAVKFDKFKG